jgi:hypothetical protein
MIIRFDDKNAWQIPVFPQSDDFEYRSEICCECCEDNVVESDKSRDEGIVGISEDKYGRLMLLHECPRCGKKWKSHITCAWNNAHVALEHLALVLYLRRDKYKEYAIESEAGNG